MVEAVVEFEYTAQEPDELTLVKGDVISNIKKMEGGWWEGVLKGKKGVFPDNFVKVLEPNSPPQDDKIRQVNMRKKGVRRCRVLFSYKPVNEDELELHESDLIEVLGEVEEGWWRGKLNNKVGVFPSNFVQEESDAENKPTDNINKDVKSPAGAVKLNLEEKKVDKTPSPCGLKKDEVLSIAVNSDQEIPTLPPRPSREMCKVRFSYSAVNDDELELHVGEIVTLLSKHTQEPGWWKGEISGKVGVFPDNFVEIIPADEAAKKPSEMNHTSKVRVNADAGDVATISAKFKEDSPNKVDDKVPPVIKKPAVPPVSKKPAPKVTTKVDTSDSVDGVSGEPDIPHGRTSVLTQPPTVATKQSSEFDIVERTAMLTHPTVTRVKAPRRRPPSTVFKESESGANLTNGDSEEKDEEDPPKEENEKESLKEYERQAAKLSWVEELRQNQARNRKAQSQVEVVPPVVEKKPPPSLIIPSKPSEAKVRPVSGEAPPTVASRSPLQEVKLLPPPSSPRRLSPSTEQPAVVLPVALKRPSDSKTNGLKPVVGKPPLDLPDSKLTSEKSLLDRMSILESRYEQLEKNLLEERTKRIALEKEVTRLKNLTTQF